MLENKTRILFSTVTALLATSLYTWYPTTTTIRLPNPANISDIPNVVYLTEDMVDHIPGVMGGESLVNYQGDIVTGTLDGYLVGIDPDNLDIRWRIKCPLSESGGKCRILGLRVVEDDLYGLDLYGRLFKFKSGEFQWLLDSNSPEISSLSPGFLNDLVVVRDMIYITDTFEFREDKKHLNMFQRFAKCGSFR